MPKLMQAAVPFLKARSVKGLTELLIIMDIRYMNVLSRPHRSLSFNAKGRDAQHCIALITFIVCIYW